MPTLRRQQIEPVLAQVRGSLAHHQRFVLGLEPAAHHRAWISELQSGAPRLLIIAPPRHAKTTVVGISYPSWLIGNDPNVHIAYCSNTARQANRQSVAVRDVVRLNGRFKLLYPGTALDPGKGTGESEWFVRRPNEADKDATFQCTGVGGPILGAGVDVLVLDDVADQENMATQHQREKLLEWVRHTILTRLNPGGKVRCIMTRWHEGDPAGEFMGDNWRVINTPAIDPATGGALWPEAWPLEKLEAVRREIGTHAFELMYQGNVLVGAAAVFRREWFRYWLQKDGAAEPVWVVQSWDTAHETGQARDFSVCTTWALTAQGHYLLDLYRKRVAFPQLKEDAVSLARKWRARYVLIEAAASGRPLIQELLQGTDLPLVKVEVQGDKEARAHACTPEFETGRVVFPREPGWVQDVEHELLVFPKGEHDDIVDSVTQYLNWARGRAGRPAFSAGRKESLWKER